MTDRLRVSLATAGLLILGASDATVGRAQQSAAAPAAAPVDGPIHALPDTPPASCPSTGPGDPFLAEVQRAHALGGDAAVAALEVLEPEARRRAEAAPHDAAAQYGLAAVIGARLEHEDGSSKIETAVELHDQAMRVLTLAPGHAGANYMVGRLHSGVLRLGTIERFVATQLLGGGALEDASWEVAQAHLEAAVAGAPCVPEHHFELARAYARGGDLRAAERVARHVLQLTGAVTTGDPDARLRQRTEELLEEIRRGG